MILHLPSIIQFRVSVEKRTSPSSQTSHILRLRLILKSLFSSHSFLSGLVILIIHHSTVEGKGEKLTLQLALKRKNSQAKNENSRGLALQQLVHKTLARQLALQF